MYTKGQHNLRREDSFRDQHGRVWGANIEIATGDPCEALAPLGWTAPAAPHWARGSLIPPEDCREMVPIRERNIRGYQVRINYQRWLNAWDAAFEAHTRKLYDFAMGMAGGGDVDRLVANPTPALRQIVGDPPSPPREFIEAAAAGNRWALGQSETVPVGAVPILDRMRPLVTARRRTADQAVDPFADEDSEPATLTTVLEEFHVPDPFADAVSEVSVKPKRREKAA